MARHLLRGVNATCQPNPQPPPVPLAHLQVCTRSWSTHAYMPSHSHASTHQSAYHPLSISERPMCCICTAKRADAVFIECVRFHSLPVSLLPSLPTPPHGRQGHLVCCHACALKCAEVHKCVRAHITHMQFHANENTNSTCLHPCLWHSTCCPSAAANVLFAASRLCASCKRSVKEN